MDLTPELVAWIGILIGIFARIMLPYLRKTWTGDIKEFDIYYLWVALMGLVASVIVSMLIAPDMLINANATFFELLSTNFTIGFGSTSLINEIFDMREVISKEEVAPPPESTPESPPT